MSKIQAIKHLRDAVPSLSLARARDLVYELDGMITAGAVNAHPSTETLRDRFAAAALTGLMSDPSAQGTPYAYWAAKAYKLADAMLKARVAQAGEDAA